MIKFSDVVLRFLNSNYIIKSERPIEFRDAIDSLVFGLKCEGLFLLPEFPLIQEPEKTASLILPGVENVGIVKIKISKNKVPCNLSFKLKVLSLVVYPII